MTNEQINLAIARVLGWHSIHTSTTGIKGMKGPLRGFMPIPNYCADLNAMHEAEATLGKSFYRMEAQLKRMAGAICFHASARQRAEAFLRTLGKWEAATEDSSVDHFRDATKKEEVQP